MASYSMTPSDPVAVQLEKKNQERFKSLVYPKDLQNEGNRHMMVITIYRSNGVNLETSILNRIVPSAIDNLLKGGGNAKYKSVNSVFDALDNGITYAGDKLKQITSTTLDTLDGIVKVGNIGFGSARNASSAKEAGNRSRESTNLRGLTEKVDRQICLYLPEKVGVSYGIEYSDGTDMSTLSALRGLFGIFADRNMDPSLKTDLLREFGTGKFVRALDFVGGLFGDNPNAEGFLAASTRQIKNPHMEFLFRAVSQRKFDFTFNFTPKSEAEAITVYEIIKTLKFYAHPEINKSGRFYNFPAEFEIEYHFNGKENTYLNKIGRVALEGIDVDYSAAGVFSAFKEHPSYGSPPTNITVTLKFAELELMHQGRIEQGY